MSADRFRYQQDCVRYALARFPGLVISIGARDDGNDAYTETGGRIDNRLKPLDPQRVVLCDLSPIDEVYDESSGEPVVVGGKPNTFDRLFDCARDPWPFEDGSACLVVFGDILEHLTPDDIRAALTEARRVSKRVCITTPEDRRQTNTNERADKYRRGHVHRTVVTRELLEGIMADVGWKTLSWQFLVYDDGGSWGERTMGHFVQAE